jgi:hypothetical protein
VEFQQLRGSEHGIDHAAPTQLSIQPSWRNIATHMHVELLTELFVSTQRSEHILHCIHDAALFLNGVRNCVLEMEVSRWGDNADKRTGPKKLTLFWRAFTTTNMVFSKHVLVIFSTTRGNLKDHLGQSSICKDSNQHG